jgi:GAF domain-containing protein
MGGSPSESLVRIGTRTGMYAPMLWKERALGVLSVDTTHPRGQFTKDDLRLLLAVAHFAALALAAQRRV